MNTRSSDLCYENCKPFELLLKEKLNTKKTKLIDLLHVKLLRMKQNNSLCLKK